jgi:hypothetical protein
MLRRLTGARTALLCALTLLVIPSLAGDASARVRIHMRTTQVVAGAVRFAVGGAGARARRVVFLVDGRARWTARRRPFRFGRTGLLNTRTLRNGVHVLAVRVYYAHRRVKIARRRIVVSNRRRPASSLAHQASSGAHHASSSVHPAPSTPQSATGLLNPPGASSGGTPGSPVAFFNRETYAYSSSLSYAQEAQRYQVIVLQSTDYALVPLLKAANPNLRILVYQHTWFSKPGDSDGLTVCTSYQSDAAQHPSWFLYDASGHPVPARASGNYLMDPDNPSYQQACFAHAIALAKQYGFDGIFLDDILATPAWEMAAGAPLPPTYPTTAAWQAAMTNMLANAAAAFHAQGLLTFANLSVFGTAAAGSALWQTWSAPLDGSEEEAWTGQPGDLLGGVSTWPAQLANLGWDEAHGKYTIVHSYDATETGNTYGLASMMLAAGGLSSYSTANSNYTNNEMWYPEYGAAQQLGAPIGAYFQLANGVYERVFAKGIVLVNPTGRSVNSFSLGGHTYSGSGLTNATSVSMAPTSGYVLQEVG